MLQIDTRTRLERLVPFGWMLVGFAVLYLLWVLLIARDSAWAPIGKEPEQLLPWLMGTEPKIVAFYAPQTMVRGEPATICYGVLNVRSVRIDPPVEEIKPSLNRCIAVAPQQTTVYTLYATGNDGKQLTASFTTVVVPPPPSFLFVDTSGPQIRRGDRYSVCYGVKNAVSVKLTPPSAFTPPSPKHCVMFFPQVSMQYAITATGEDGRTQTLKWPVKVGP